VEYSTELRQADSAHRLPVADFVTDSMMTDGLNYRVITDFAPRARLRINAPPRFHQIKPDKTMITPDELLSAAIAVLAVLFISYTFVNVGIARGRTKIDAPAVTGHPTLERAYRVQLNTVEQAIMFFPLLWMATRYFHTLGWLPAAFGLVWVIGRFVYLQGYMSAPAKRSTGFLISLVASMGLLVLSIVGVVHTWMVITAS
jgi:glutathione S-transferase